MSQTILSNQRRTSVMTYDVRGTEVKNNTLLNLTWSDGDFTEAGTIRPLFTDEQKQKITFNKHKWLGGEVVVSYDDKPIYITFNGLKANQTVASEILHAIETGYSQSQELLED